MAGCENTCFLFLVLSDLTFGECILRTSGYGIVDKYTCNVLDFKIRLVEKEEDAISGLDIVMDGQRENGSKKVTTYWVELT